jgi:hypothetical protein
MPGAVVICSGGCCVRTAYPDRGAVAGHAPAGSGFRCIRAQGVGVGDGVGVDVGGHGEAAGWVPVSTALDRLAMMAGPSGSVRKPPKSGHISIELACKVTPLPTAPHQSMILAGEAV